MKLKAIDILIFAVLILGAAFIYHKTETDAVKKADTAFCESVEGLNNDYAEILKCADLGVPYYIDKLPYYR